jgi:hypothetical protein
MLEAVDLVVEDRHRDHEQLEEGRHERADERQPARVVQRQHELRIAAGAGGRGLHQHGGDDDSRITIEPSPSGSFVSPVVQAMG